MANKRKTKKINPVETEIAISLLERDINILTALSNESFEATLTTMINFYAEKNGVMPTDICTDVLQLIITQGIVETLGIDMGETE